MYICGVPVSRVFVLPVYIWRKSWYSFVSDNCIFADEYIFIVAKNDTSSDVAEFIPCAVR